MLMNLYVRMSPLLAAFLLLTTVVFFSMCLWRGEIILGLQSDALKDKDNEIKVVIQQRDGANKISHEYEVLKADKLQEKVYVDREVEKIVLMPSYGNECFNNDGLLSLNSAITALNDSGKSTDAVHENTGAKRWQRQHYS